MPYPAAAEIFDWNEGDCFAPIPTRVACTETRKGQARKEGRKGGRKKEGRRYEKRDGSRG